MTKSDSWIDYSTLEGCLREDLDPKAPRGMAVLDPVKLVITNWDAVMGEGTLDECSAPVHPHMEVLGKRTLRFGKELWIERTDYEETPPKGFFRLFPGNKVRMKYGHIIECTGADKDAEGNVTAVHATLIPDTKSGTPGADSVKVKGVITWVGATEGVPAEVRLYDRLFLEEMPDAGGKDFIEALNPESLQVVNGYVEPSLAQARSGRKIPVRTPRLLRGRPGGPRGRAGKLVFNRVTGLKDSWGK